MSLPPPKTQTSSASAGLCPPSPATRAPAASCWFVKAPSIMSISRVVPVAVPVTSRRITKLSATLSGVSFHPKQREHQLRLAGPRNPEHPEGQPKHHQHQSHSLFQESTSPVLLFHQSPSIMSISRALPVTPRIEGTAERPSSHDYLFSSNSKAPASSPSTGRINRSGFAGYGRPTITSISQPLLPSRSLTFT